MSDSTHPQDETYYQRVTRSTEAGRTIRAYGDQHLRGYLRSLVPTEPLSDTPAAQALLQALADAAAAHYPPITVRRALAEFQRRPALQLADGADLLLDIETLLNHLTYQLACRESGTNAMWTQQCTTVRALRSATPLSGPAIVETDRDSWRILPGSRNALAHSNVACLGETALTASPLGRKTARYARLPPPELLKPYLGQHHPRACAAILDANRGIWSQLHLKAKKQLILLDEELSADLIARHLRHELQPLSAIILDPRWRSVFNEVKRAAVQAPDNFILRDTTTLFRIRDGPTLRPCRLIEHSDRPAILTGTPHGPSVPLTRAALTEALDQRVLYPDLILSYLALVVLPGVAAFGGTSQHEYLPRIERMLIQAHQHGLALPHGVAERINTATQSRLIGPALLDLTPRQHQALLALNPDTDLDEFEHEVLDRTVGEAAGGLPTLTYLDQLRTLRSPTPQPH